MAIIRERKCTGLNCKPNNQQQADNQVEEVRGRVNEMLSDNCEVAQWRKEPEVKTDDIQTILKNREHHTRAWWHLLQRHQQHTKLWYGRLNQRTQFQPIQRCSQGVMAPRLSTTRTEAQQESPRHRWIYWQKLRHGDKNNGGILLFRRKSPFEWYHYRTWLTN